MTGRSLKTLNPKDIDITKGEGGVIERGRGRAARAASGERGGADNGIPGRWRRVACKTLNLKQWDELVSSLSSWKVNI